MRRWRKSNVSMRRRARVIRNSRMSYTMMTMIREGVEEGDKWRGGRGEEEEQEVEESQKRIVPS